MNGIYSCFDGILTRTTRDMRDSKANVADGIVSSKILALKT